MRGKNAELEKFRKEAEEQRKLASDMEHKMQVAEQQIREQKVKNEAERKEAAAEHARLLKVRKDERMAQQDARTKLDAEKLRSKQEV